MSSPPHLRLGVNIDHVATVRNARGGRASRSGARGEARDRGRRRRHHRASARGSPPHPRRRHRAPEGGDRQAAQSRNGGDRRDGRDRDQDAAACRLPRSRATRGAHHRGRPRCRRAAQSARAGRSRSSSAAGIRVSLFIAAEPGQIEAAARLGAPVIEIHTGAWCDALAEGRATAAQAEWQRIQDGARLARSLGLEVHAGHGLNYATAETIAALPRDRRAQHRPFPGRGGDLRPVLPQAVRSMRAAMDRGRAKVAR